MKTLIDQYIGMFDRESWDMMVTALTHFIREQEESLMKENASAEDWERLHQYEILLTDIRFYVLANKNRL